MIPGMLEIFTLFLRVGFTAFGAATSEVIIKELVERRGWVNLEEFKESLAMVGLLPGPFHINLVMSLGFRLLGLRGQMAALMGFILPSFILASLLITLISFDEPLAFLKGNPGVLKGMLAAVTALLAGALLKLARGLERRPVNVVLLLLLLGGLWVFELSFALVILGGGLLYLLSRILLPGEHKL